MHKDKIRGDIIENNIRVKISSGELNREDYDDKKLHGFLYMLKRRPATKVNNMKELAEEDFRTLSKQSKRRSASSIFSKRDYSVCKCAMCCERTVKVLLRFYNVMIKHNHFPSRYLDMLDVMIEKGKGNKINKLRVMKIIEAYLQLLVRKVLGLRIVEND